MSRKTNIKCDICDKSLTENWDHYTWHSSSESSIPIDFCLDCFRKFNEQMQLLTKRLRKEVK